MTERGKKKLTSLASRMAGDESMMLFLKRFMFFSPYPATVVS